MRLNNKKEKINTFNDTTSPTYKNILRVLFYFIKIDCITLFIYFLYFGTFLRLFSTLFFNRYQDCFIYTIKSILKGNLDANISYYFNSRCSYFSAYLQLIGFKEESSCKYFCKCGDYTQKKIRPHSKPCRFCK